MYRILFLFFLCSCQSFAQFYDGRTQKETDVQQLVQSIQPGTILFLGEYHGVEMHRDQHIEILKALKNQGLKVSVGLEFINYTDQQWVDQYLRQQIDEPTFLKAIQWGGISFDYYKQQLLFPDINNNEYARGLNIPKSVTSTISKTGLNSLTAEQVKLLPPQFTVGSDAYKVRFMVAAGAHCKTPENCFIAQSAWDDTIAWQATEFIKAHPDQVLVIVIGEFHVQYGGGTPARVKARSPQTNIVTLSQIWADGLSDDDVSKELLPSSVEGPRADFIWISRP